jgi:hypothetical protein
MLLILFIYFSELQPAKGPAAGSRITDMWNCIKKLTRLAGLLLTVSACASGKVKQEEDPAQAANLCEEGRTDNRLSCRTSQDDVMHAQNKGDFAFTIDHPYTNLADFEVTWTAFVGKYTFTFYQADDPGCAGPSSGFGSVRSLREPKVNAAMIDDGDYYFCVFADSDKYPTIAAKNNGFRMTLDTVAPEAPEAGGLLYTSETRPTWHWTSQDTSAAGKFRVALGDEEFSDDADEISEKSWQSPTALADGQYFFFVQERDEAGNWSESGAFDTIVDTKQPKPELEQVSDSTAPDKLHVLLTFSEPVSGFDKSDIKISSGTITGITGDGTKYTISFTSTAEEPTIEILADGCKDLSGNLCLASEPLSVTNNTIP